MIVPERTLESWLAMEIERELPGAVVWCPTQPRQAITSSGQAGPDPWDFVVDARHLFAFEAKGLEEGALVPIWMEQFNALRGLSPAIQRFIYYAVPALAAAEIVGASPVRGTSAMPTASQLQRNPPFGVWGRSLTLDEVDAALGAKAAQKIPRLDGAALKSYGLPMRQFLAKVKQCTETPSGAEAAALLREGGEGVHQLEARRLMWVLVP